MCDLRLKKITIEPLQTLIIQNGDIIMTNTTVSTNVLNGCLVLDGGISVNCTYDSISSTSGGAITIGGGLAVRNKAFFGSNVILDSNSSTFSINGVLNSTSRLFMDSVQNKNFYISPDGISKRFDLYDTVLNINITTNSNSASVGSLVLNGGLSINNTFDAINSSSGGALTIGGGLAVGGNSYLSKSLTIGQLNNNTFGLFVRYTGTSQYHYKIAQEIIRVV